jgi:hypothetical protein
VTIVAAGRAKAEGFQFIGFSNPASAPFRAKARAALIQRAAEGSIVVPIARTFPLGQAKSALALLRGRHPSGKLALIPGS